MIQDSSGEFKFSSALRVGQKLPLPQHLTHRCRLNQQNVTCKSVSFCLKATHNTHAWNQVIELGINTLSDHTHSHSHSVNIVNKACLLTGRRGCDVVFE